MAIMSISHAEETVPPELGIYEHLDAFISNDLIFTNHNGEVINLKESIAKPTVINLVYYECPGICTPLLEGVAEVIDRTDIMIGEDYDVFTISFDYDEKTALAKKKRNTFLKQVKTKDASNGWTFFTGDSANVNRLLDELGFKVKKEGAEYIHPSAIIVLSPEGKITRYLHGTYFLPFDLKMSVIEASKGKSGPTINKVLKYCFNYDPDGKTYVMNITKVSGTIIIVLAILIFISLIIFTKKRNPKSTQYVKH